MAPQERRRPGTTLWAYAYEIVPPQTIRALRRLRPILDREHAAAGNEDRTWSGRFILERHVTQILIVADSPDQGRDVNRRIEAELKRLEAVYSLTVPMDVTAGEKVAAPPPGRGNGRLPGHRRPAERPARD